MPDVDALREENSRLKCDVDRLLAEQGRAEGEIQRLRLENTSLKETNQSLNNGNSWLEERLAAVENELELARRELEERADTESQIREFDEVLGRVEQMKESYERRISSLKAMIKALKESERGEDSGASEELAVIEMDSQVPSKSVRVNPKYSDNQEIHSETDSDGDWLEDLPDD